jgi:hypothetical protein
MQFSQDIHCCCPLGHIERIAAEQASGVAASVKIVLWQSASENEQESMSACQSDAHALAVLATGCHGRSSPTLSTWRRT